MVETAHANTLEEYLHATSGHEHVLFRGQSTEYPAIVPSLFRQREPLEIAPLLNAADELYLAAHGVMEAMARVRERDQYYLTPLGQNPNDDDEDDKGLLGRLSRWIGRMLFPSLYNREDNDDYNLLGVPLGSGMGTEESYSKVFSYALSRVPTERRSMAMLQHYGAPSGALDVSFERLVSLWFACHVYEQQDGRVRYRRSDRPGVVYVMDVPDEHFIDIRGGETIEFDDRKAVVPIAGLRAWRQHGGLAFGSTIDDPDLTRYVVKKITIAPGVFDDSDDRLKPFTQKRLFPGPDEDDYYAELLKAKESDDPQTRRLAAFIPLYVDR